MINITAIDPETGQVGPPVFIGSEPGQLAMSDQGRYLYVALDGDTPGVRRSDTVAQAATPSFSLGSSNGPNYAEEMAVAPGHPETVAVARNTKWLSPWGTGVAIYDDGIARPGIGHDANTIAFGATASRLYGYHSEVSDFTFSRWNVDASGITGGDALWLMSGYNLRILFDGGRLYDTSGGVYDPEAGVRLGTVPPGVIRPDGALRKVFILQGDGTDAQLLVYDAGSFSRLGAFRFSGIRGSVDSLIRWGADGVAFRTGAGLVFLLRTGQLSPHPLALSLALSSPAATVGLDVYGTVTLSEPAPPPGLTLTLSSTNPAAVSVPPAVTVPAGATTASFPVTALPASVATDLSIVAIGPGGTASAALQTLPRAEPAGNRLINGSFEEPDVGASVYPWGFAYGPQPDPLYPSYRGLSIPGWQITRGTVDVQRHEFPAIDGQQSLELVGSPGAATIQQSFVTKPGQEYVFSGYVAHNPQLTAARMDVLLNGTLFARLGSNDYYDSNRQFEDRWAFFALRFRAASRITTLALMDVTNSSPTKGTELDGLAVTPSRPPAGLTGAVLPSPPSGLTARVASAAEVDLTWNDNSDNETGIFIARQGTDGFLPYLGLVPPHATSFADLDVKPGQSYTYWVAARTNWGFAAGPEEATVTLPASAPLPAATLLVSNAATGRVLRYDAQSGALIDAFIGTGQAIQGGESLAIGSDGDLYVGSGTVPYVLRYDAHSGARIGTFVDGSGTGLDRIGGMAFGPDGNLYISSPATHEVQRFYSQNGGFLGAFVPAGAGGLQRPGDLSFGPDGNLYVASQGNRSVLRYDGKTGVFIDAFVSSGSGGLRDPDGLAFGPGGDLYVSDGGADSVLRFSGTTGAFVNAFVPPRGGGLAGAFDCRARRFGVRAACRRFPRWLSVPTAFRRPRAAPVPHRCFRGGRASKAAASRTHSKVAPRQSNSPGRTGGAEGPGVRPGWEPVRREHRHQSGASIRWTHRCFPGCVVHRRRS